MGSIPTGGDAHLREIEDLHAIWVSVRGQQDFRAECRARNRDASGQPATGKASDAVSEPILVPNDALPCFACKMKFQVGAEKLITVEAHAAECKAILEEAKRLWDYMFGWKAFR